MPKILDKNDAVDALLEISKTFRGVNDQEVMFASAVLYTLAASLEKGTTAELATFLLECVTRSGELLRDTAKLAGNPHVAPEDSGSKRLN